MLERWDAQFGRETADLIARASLAPPETYVRAPGELPPGLNLEPTEVPAATAWPGPGTGLADSGHRFADRRSAARTEPGRRSWIFAPLRGIRRRKLSNRACACCLRSPPEPFGTHAGTRVRPGSARRDPSAAFPKQIRSHSGGHPMLGHGTLARNPEIKWRLAHRMPDMQDGRCGCFGMPWNGPGGRGPVTPPVHWKQKKMRRL